MNFSESPENKASVQPSIAYGIVYANATQAAGPAKGQSFTGAAGNDVFIGTVGNDTINGGLGLDVSVYGGTRASYTIANGARLTVSGGGDGTDTLTNVERLRFDDAALAFDTSGSAEFESLMGSNSSNTQFVDLMYANVLHRAPNQSGYDYWLSQMQGGTAREMVLIGFSESPENQAALIGVIQGGIEYIAG